MDNDALLATAHLAGPLAGDPPQLDSLLEWALSLYHSKAVPGYKVDRKYPAPPPGDIPIPILRVALGRFAVGCCSSPILPVPDAEWVEHVAKRIGVERAGLLAEPSRLVVATTNSWTKSYRLPLRCRRVACVKWFARGDRRETLKLLRKAVPSLGKKVADGYGRVERWEVERVDGDASWFARSPLGPVLMRPLPVGPWLPDPLLGARRSFGACAPPYWHPDRYGEIVVPC